MDKHHLSKLLLCVLVPCFVLILLLVSFLYCRRRRQRSRELLPEPGECAEEEQEAEPEQLISFAGGEGLTVAGILEAHGEVVKRCSYGTVYRASLPGGVMLLRFVRPAACAAHGDEAIEAVRALGAAEHPNLVPVRALYVGRRGEKLLLHPYYTAGTLARFLRDGLAESCRWEIIYKLSLGIARGLNHLHTVLNKPIIHGNLKMNNILLDANLQPRLSNFGLHLLLNPTACQQVLEVSAAQGYKAPELIKMKEASTESDIYSLGVILLEMLTQEEPIKSIWLQSQDVLSPTSYKELVLDHKISHLFSSELLAQSNNSVNGEGLLKFFELAIACCSPSPALRPDSKIVLQRLEEIAI